MVAEPENRDRVMCPTPLSGIVPAPVIIGFQMWMLERGSNITAAFKTQVDIITKN
jgi:hypothetical protein